MASLVIEKLSKRFGRTQALSQLDLSINNSEFLILLGPTGAGKTTTLRCVAGLEKPDEGRITMDGEPMNQRSPAERDVSFVFQSYALYPRKTVFQNMAFPLEARAMSRAQIEARVTEIARKLSIDGLLNRRPAELSGGQQQRVALGRAMVRQPRLFLMDEPLTNLDFKLRVEMRAELKRLQSELAATFFYVTNDQVEAMSMADRIAILNHGVLQQVDTPENIYDKPANQFVAGFVGSPRMNFLACHVDLEARLVAGQDGAWSIPLGSDQIAHAAQRGSGDAVFGIRPEDIVLSSEPVEGSAPVEVYVIEPLGDRTIVDVRLGQEMLKVKTSASFAANSGDQLHLRFDPAHMHIFDPKTGAVIL